MNGQPYSNSGSNSANGTPTPSSTSYPASLSSHSSRDASPSRLPPNLNHINPEKPSYFTSNHFTQNYKNNQDSSPNANTVNLAGFPHSQNENINSGINKTFSSPQTVNNSYGTSRISHLQSRNIIATTTPQLVNSDLSLNQQKMQLSSQQPSGPINPMQKQVLAPKPEIQMRSPENYSSYYNTSQGVPPSSNTVTNIHSQSMPQFRQQDHFQSPPVIPNRLEQIPPNSVQGLGPKSPPIPSSQSLSDTSTSQSYNLSQGISSSTDNLLRPTSHPNYHSNFPPTSNPAGSYGNQRLPYPTTQNAAPPPPNRSLQEEPISSGPPRTNVLGIIPYSSESGGTTAHSMIAPTRTVSSQSPPVSMQPVRGVSGPYPTPGYSEAPAGGINQVPNRMPPTTWNSDSQAPIARMLPTPRLPPYSQPHMSPPPRSQQYLNQYGNRPPDNYPPQIQSGQQYQNPLYQQDNVGGIPQYSNTSGYYPGVTDDLVNQVSNLSVAHAGFNRLWGKDTFDLLKSRDILPQGKVEAPPIRLQQELFEASNCSPEIFRCTLTKIPETKSLLDKSRLPLGVLIHPFKDLNQLSVIQCNIIVRCRACRTYINPFVYFVDSKHWKCNLCFRVNDLPDEFQYDPLTKTYGDPSRRPEIKSATIEFIAPSEYMVRPPQPAAYVFVIDVSRLGAEAGYLQVFCETLLSQLEALPGDSRTSVAFITFDSAVHFYSLAETQSQPHQMVVVDIDDMFLPCPENLLVNLSECLVLVRDLLKELPSKYKESFDVGSALGPALQAAYKLLAATGGRITVFQSCLANRGPGGLTSREDPSQRTADNITHAMLNPVTDFYKKLALDCSGQQIAVDLFILNSQYVDLASLCGVSCFSGGCIYHFPLFNVKNHHHIDKLQRTLQRYLCRKIGFESVMRLRCTRGLSIHTFHGNFFVRSTDLLSLPNINPDAGFGMQVSIDENLSDVQNICFQAALLYTSSKGERRIRVHTLCLPVASNLSDVLHSADQQCIVGLLAKMAVDRCHQSSLSDAREAFVNVVADMLSAFKLTQSNNTSGCLLAPSSLKLLPLYILALLKYVAFRTGQSTRLDDRLYTMCQMKSLPLNQLIQAIYPDLYPIHNLLECPEVLIGDETVVQPPKLHLSAERIDSLGVYLLDDGENIIIYVGHNISPNIASSLFNVPSFSSINPQICDLPEVDSPESEKLRSFVTFLQNEKPVSPTVQIIRDDSPQRQRFLEKLVEDKNESGHSYYEFLQRVKMLVK